MLDLKRKAAIIKLFIPVNQIYWALVKDEDACSYTCDAIRLGVLTKEMMRAGILRQPKPPFPNLSVTGLISLLQKFKLPQWPDKKCQQKDTTSTCNKQVCRCPSTCDLWPRIMSSITEQEEGIEGLSLEKFKDGERFYETVPEIPDDDIGDEEATCFPVRSHSGQPLPPAE